jgi:hypothetical protein
MEWRKERKREREEERERERERDMARYLKAYTHKAHICQRKGQRMTERGTLKAFRVRKDSPVLTSA